MSQINLLIHGEHRHMQKWHDGPARKQPLWTSWEFRKAHALRLSVRTPRGSSPASLA
jgi:hypothetical protein